MNDTAIAPDLAPNDIAPRAEDPRQAGWKDETCEPAIGAYNAAVPVADIERDPNNRTPTKERVEELAKTIEAEGLLQPIVLRDLGGNRYRIIAGETRWLAFKHLKRPAIPAMIRQEKDDAAAVAKRLIENLTRSDLNPVDEARGFKQLCELGRTQKQVGELFGKSQPVIANMIRMLACPPDVLELVQHGKLSAAHGVSLARFAKFPKIALEIAECAVQYGWTAKNLDQQDVPFAHSLKQRGMCQDINTRKGYDNDPAYAVPKELLERDEFIAASNCVYYLREPGTPDLWTPEKRKQDEAREKKEKAAKAKQTEQVKTGKKTKEQVERANKIKANRQLRADIDLAHDDSLAALRAAKEITPDMQHVLIEHAMAYNYNSSGLEEAEAELGITVPPRKKPSGDWKEDLDHLELMGVEPLNAVKLAVAAILLRRRAEALRYLSTVPVESRLIAQAAPARNPQQLLERAAARAEISPAKCIVVAHYLDQDELKVGEIAKRCQVKPDQVKAVQLELETTPTLDAICAQMHAAAEAQANKDPQRAAIAAKTKKGTEAARINDEVRNQVRTLHLGGKSMQDIAKALGLSVPSVQNIKKDLGLVNPKPAPAAAGGKGAK